MLLLRTHKKLKKHPTNGRVIQIFGYDPVSENSCVRSNAHVVDINWRWIGEYANNVYSRLASVTVRNNSVFPWNPELAIFRVVQSRWTLGAVGSLHRGPCITGFPALNINTANENGTRRSAYLPTRHTEIGTVSLQTRRATGTYRSRFFLTLS